MSSNSESGHSKNVALLNELVTSVVALQADYNPSKESIKLPALQALSTNAQSAIESVNIANAAYSNALAAREVGFEPINKLVTRCYNSLKASDTTEQVDENARAIVRKMRGTRATAKKTDEQKKALADEGKEVKEISTAQTSFDGRLSNFEKFITQLESVQQYAPNENELKVDSLKVDLATLKSMNATVITLATQLSNARILRNDLFYKPNTGLVDIAFDTKMYIKSLFGASSPQYKQISGLKFKGIKA